MLVLGLGAGFSFVSITTAALARVDDEAAGLASGLLSTFVQLGGALGVAALITVASERSSDLLGSGSRPLVAQVGGLNLAFLLAAAVALAASLVAMFALPRLRTEDVAAAAPTGPEALS
jgi:predicted MFS family arabinose efflux permease